MTTGAGRHGADLSNARLITATALTLTGGLFLAVLIPALPDPWGLPGGPLLQAAAAVGSALLLASFAAVLAKRFGGDGKRRFHAHVWLASVGAALVFAHGASNLGRPPALLLAMLAGLILLGVWSRTRGAALMAGTFGEKRRAFAAPDASARERLREIVAEKERLLARIEPGANEGVFSLGPAHYRRAPLAAFAYARLAAAEARLTGARAAVHPAQAVWRLLHRLLAWGFVLGLAGHILVVMLFARYAADDRAIYWLHFAAWDF